MSKLTDEQKHIIRLVSIGATVRQLNAYLKKHPDTHLKFTDEFGRTLLFYCRSVSLATHLIDQCGISPFQKDDSGSTPLHYAVCFARTDIVEFYLNRGLNPSARNNQGLTPILCVSACGDKRVAKLLESRGASFFETDNDGNNALFYAVRHRGDEHIAYIKMLLNEKGIDVNASDKKGNNLLHLIVKKTMFQKCLLLLLSKGVNPTLRNNEGRTPLDELIERNSLIVSYIEWSQILKKAMRTWEMKEAENQPFSVSEIALARKNGLDIHLIDQKTAQKMPYPEKNSFKAVYYALNDEIKMLIKRAINKGHILRVDNIVFSNETIKLLDRALPTKRTPKILDVSTIERN